MTGDPWVRPPHGVALVFMLACAVALAGAGLPAEALAVTGQYADDPFAPIASKGQEGINKFLPVLQVAGVIGCIAVVAVAIFTKKFPIAWLGYIFVGFLIVALSPSLIQWISSVGQG